MSSTLWNHLVRYFSNGYEILGVLVNLDTSSEHYGYVIVNIVFSVLTQASQIGGRRIFNMAEHIGK